MVDRHGRLMGMGEVSLFPDPGPAITNSGGAANPPQPRARPHAADRD